MKRIFNYKGDSWKAIGIDFEDDTISISTKHIGREENVTIKYLFDNYDKLILNVTGSKQSLNK